MMFSAFLFFSDLGTREKNDQGAGCGSSSNVGSPNNSRFCHNMREKAQNEETQRPVNFPPRKRSIPYGMTLRK